MQPIEITWTHVLKIWWAYTWRTMLGGLVLGGAIGFVLGFVAGMLHVDFKGWLLALQVVCGLAGGIWSIYMIRVVLNKNFGDFRIVLVQNS